MHSTITPLTKAQKAAELQRLRRLRGDLAASLPLLSGSEKEQTWKQFQATQALILALRK